MGFHTSAPVAFLMTLFNVRLGLWLRSPKAGPGKQLSRWGLWYLLKELFATETIATFISPTEDILKTWASMS
jgi:hypothetical protein